MNVLLCTTCSNQYTESDIPCICTACLETYVENATADHNAKVQQLEADLIRAKDDLERAIDDAKEELFQMMLHAEHAHVNDHDTEENDTGAGDS